MSLTKRAANIVLRKLARTGDIDATSTLNGVTLPLPTQEEQRKAISDLIPGTFNADIYLVDIGKIGKCAGCFCRVPFVQMQYLSIKLFMDGKETFQNRTYLEKCLLPEPLYDSEDRVVTKMVCSLCATYDAAVQRDMMRATWTAQCGSPTAQKLFEEKVNIDDMYDDEMELRRDLKRALEKAGFAFTGRVKEVKTEHPVDMFQLSPLVFE